MFSDTDEIGVDIIKKAEGWSNLLVADGKIRFVFEFYGEKSKLPEPDYVDFGELLEYKDVLVEDILQRRISNDYAGNPDIARRLSVTLREKMAKRKAKKDTLRKVRYVFALLVLFGGLLGGLAYFVFK